MSMQRLGPGQPSSSSKSAVEDLWLLFYMLDIVCISLSVSLRDKNGYASAIFCVCEGCFFIRLACKM